MCKIQTLYVTTLKYFAKLSQIAAKFIYIKDLDTLLQLLIENKAHYLEINTGLLQYLEGFRTSFNRFTGRN